MYKKYLKALILLILFSSVWLAVFDSLMSQYYYPRSIGDVLFTFLTAFWVYLLTNILTFAIPAALIRLSNKSESISQNLDKYVYFLLAPFIFGLFALLSVPDLYEIRAADWKYLLISLAGAVLYLRFFSYLLDPDKDKKILAVSGAAVMAAFFAGVFLLNPSNVLFPSKGDPKGGSASKPNFILIFLDAMRGDCISLVGNKIKTPNFDRFMSRGTVFTNAYSNAPLTQMSMPSFFASQYPTTVRLGDSDSYVVPQGDRILTKELKKKGYDTAAIVGNLILNEYIGFAQGFDYYLLFNNYIYNNRYLAALPVISEGLLKNSRDLVSRMIRKLAGILNINPFNVTSEFAVELATEYVSRPHEKPFFLWLHLMDPHDPYTPPNYKTDYSGGLHKRFFAPHNYHPLESDFYSGKYLPTEEDKKHIEKIYYAEMEYLDRVIAPLLSKIGELDNTVVVIASDHGEGFWEHGIFYHSYIINREMIHVPLAFYGPGVPKGRLISAPVSNINVVPTVRELLGLPFQKEEEGESLAGFFKKGTHVELKPNFIELFDSHRGVIFDDYYLIKDYSPTGRDYLFNLKNDPGQLKNLKDELPEIMIRGVSLINKFKETHHPIQKQAGHEEKVRETNKKLRSLGYIQ